MSDVERNVLRLGVVTDIHHGLPAGTKTGVHALPLLREVGRWADEAGIDLLIDLGDRINNLKRDNDLRLTREVAQVFGEFATPRAHLLGNHDNHEMSRADAEAAMGVSFASWSCDRKGFHLVFWNADTHITAQGLRYTAAELAWLKADLQATQLPSVVFTHLPLDEGSMIGNFYFERYFADLAYYADSGAVRDVLERSGKVVLCVAGHTHWNARNTIDGIHYVTVQSLSESYTTWPHPSGAYALLELGEDIRVDVFGRDTMGMRLPMRARDQHWANLSRPYAPQPTDLSPWLRARMAALEGPAADLSPAPEQAPSRRQPAR